MSDKIEIVVNEQNNSCLTRCIVCGTTLSGKGKTCSKCRANSNLSKANYLFEFNDEDEKVIKKHYATFESKKAESSSVSTKQNNAGKNTVTANSGNQISERELMFLEWSTKPEEQYMAAMLYFKGNDQVSRNYSKAFMLFHKSAKQGNSDAQLKLAECYEKGYGTAVLESMALKWYRKALNNGKFEASEPIKQLEAIQRAREVERNRLERERNNQQESSASNYSYASQSYEYSQSSYTSNTATNRRKKSFGEVLLLILKALGGLILFGFAAGSVVVFMKTILVDAFRFQSVINVFGCLCTLAITASIYWYIWMMEIDDKKSVIITPICALTLVFVFSLCIFKIAPTRFMWGEFLLKREKYTEAFDVFMSLDDYNESTDIAEQIKRDHPTLITERVILTNDNYTHLSTLYPFEHYSGFEKYENVYDNLNNAYTCGFGGETEDYSWQSYKVDMEYAQLRGRIVLNGDYRTQTNPNVRLRIYCDDVLTYTSPEIKAGVMPVDFNVNVSGTNVVKIEMDGMNMIRLVDCYFYRTEDAQTVTTTVPYSYTSETEPIYLHNMWNYNSSTANSAFFSYSNVMDNLGNTYDTAFGGDNEYGISWEDYYLNKEFERFTGKVILNYEHRTETSYDVCMYVYADGYLIYQSPVVTAGIQPIDFDIDVSNITSLRVAICGSNLLRVADALIYPKAMTQNVTQTSPYGSDVVELSSLDFFNSSNNGNAVITYTSATDNQGNTYKNAVSGSNPEGQSWEVYDINGMYKKITGKVILDYERRDSVATNVYLWIYGDDELLYTSNLVTAGHIPEDFEVDITGVKMLKVVFYGQSMMKVTNCLLHKD